MEKNKNDLDYLAEVARLMHADTLPQIDFDELKVRLTNVGDQIVARDKLAGEYALLRDDCERRIAGMIKAIAAVDRKQDRLQEAIDLVAELSTLDSSHLLQTHRRIAARFRDCFPGSFGYREPGERKSRSHTSPRDSH